MFVLIASILPIAIILIWAKRTNPTYDATNLKLGKTVALSALIILPVAIIEYIVLETIPIANIKVFRYLLFTPLIEESLKFIVTNRGIKRAPKLDAYNAFLIGIYSHAGFAAVENSFFLFATPTITTAIVRAYMASTMHCIYGVIMAHFLYKRVVTNNNAYVIPALLCPMLLHGLLDITIAYKDLLIAYKLPACLIIPAISIFITIKYAKYCVKNTIENTQELPLDIVS